MTDATTLNILLVDDDDVSSESVIRSLHKHSLGFPITVAQDGSEALDILRGTHARITIEKPYLILLDLNMPGMDGFEFLTEIRADRQLCDSVIFVLTTSDADTDRSRAYHNQIAGYMVKSAVGPQFSKLATLLNSYHEAIKLPH